MSVRPDRATLRDSLSVALPALLLLLAGMLVAYQFVDPAPPARLVMAAGAEGGAYYAHAQRYRALLAREGVELTVLATAGSVENLQRLRAGSDGVQVAFVQGGIDDGQGPEGLRSLASVYFEPLWVFFRRELAVNSLADLARARAEGSPWRIAVGAPGSGTRAVALELLAANGVDETRARILEQGGDAAADALRAGDVDLVFMVGTPESRAIESLLHDEAAALLDFQRAEAYTRTRRYMSKVTLPRGIVDLVADLPPRDVVLVAPTANVVARDDLHPALVDLLMVAMGRVHREGGMFEDFGQFPSAEHVDFPLSDEADRYFESGPSFLRRVLPFWAATLVERLLVMLVPLVALLIPLIRVLPPVYRWRIRSRIYRWYRELLSIDPVVRRGEGVPADVQHGLQTLARIENEVAQVQVPLSYADQLYALRLHIELVREKLAGPDATAHEDPAKRDEETSHVDES
jgi:TRAP transporter TAXI family solute receptor